MTKNLNFGDNNRSIILRLNDESDVCLTPVNWVHIDKLTIALERLVANYMKLEGALGDLFRPSNKGTWRMIEEILNYHNVIGKDKITKENLSHFDIDDLRNLFITQTNTVTEEGNSVPNNGRLDPSMLAVINGLDFLAILRQMLKVSESLETEQENTQE